MAGWSILADGSVLECLEIVRNLQSNGFCLGLDASLKGSLSGCKDKLRCLFDHILTVFLKEISIGQELRSLPSMLGDGRCVDLFKLFWVVRRKGGYDCVCKNGLWSSVAEESGFSSGVASSLKLIYVKYLDTLDRWLQKIFNDKGVRSLSDCGGNLGVLSGEIQTDVEVMLSELSDQMNTDNGQVQLESGKNDSVLPAMDSRTHEFLLPIMDSGKNKHLLPATGDSDYTHEVPNAMQADGGKNYVDDDEEVQILDCGADTFPHKRKRECLLSSMLNWVIEVAKNPCDPAIVTVPEWSRWKSNEELWVQALLAREALVMRRQICSSDEQSIFQKKQKMHPSIYEDTIDGNHQSTEKLRCSQRILSLRNSFSSASSQSSSATRSNPKMNLTPCISALANYDNRRSVVRVGSSTLTRVCGSSDDQLRKHVAVGSLFQAQMPDWTGVPSESDSKWLGTQVWPLETSQHYALSKSDPIGKGRQDSCACRLPGSVECVRFHIAEKRMGLKVELGSAFHIWKFTYMGEEVSLSWTDEEERRFKAIVRLNPPSLGSSFWDQIYKSFPNKKRRDLVSYYFNVFLLRRRCYQNRVTPNSIDSDDDESEFGSVSNGFGHEAVKVADSNYVICVQNEQCIDWEEHT